MSALPPSASDPGALIEAPAMPYSQEECRTYLGETFWKVHPHNSEHHTQQEPAAEALHPPPVPLRSLNHLAVETHDTPRIVAFYTRVLGFKQIPRPDFKFGGAWLQGGGIMLHIIEADPTVPKKDRDWKNVYTTENPEPWYIRRGRHMALEVADVTTAEAALRAHGVTYNRFIVPGANTPQIFFFDPEGNGIELGQYDSVRDFLKHKGLQEEQPEV